jgi:hypothetical protein
MAEEKDISEVQSFSERTLKYGRNLMIAAVPMIVFAWAPGVKLAGSKPFGFNIDEGNEISIWSMMMIVLIYYGARFLFLAVIDWSEWKGRFGERRMVLGEEVSASREILSEAQQRLGEFQSRGKRDAEAKARKTHATQSSVLSAGLTMQRDYRNRRIYFWCLDAIPPFVLFVLALVVGGYEIYRLISAASGSP